jgi:hypothetical protein
VADLSQHSLKEPRRETPTPGWESGVWVRIQRRRRKHRLALGTLVLALTAAAVWVGLTRRGAPPLPAPGLRVRAELETAVRADGSAALHAPWRVAFEGAELRVYRNALGMVRRCPGDAGCAPGLGGGLLTLPLDEAGEYRALVFSRPVPGGGRTLKEDLATARARGEAVEMSPSLVVY